MKLDIIGKRKIFFGISIVALVLVLIITIVVGPKLDIQFKGCLLYTSFSVPEDSPLKGLLQTADEAASPDSDPEQASLAFICKRLRLNYKKLSEEEKKWLKKISEKSDLLKNPNPQRGRK